MPLKFRTAAEVEKLKPHKDKRVEYSDKLLQGLYLVIQPSGVKSWAVRYRHAGRPRKITLGPYPTPDLAAQALDLKAARERAKEALQAIQQGRDPATEKWLERRHTAAADNTFEAVARLFVERHQKPKNRTWMRAAWYLGLVPDPKRPEASDDPRSFLAVKDGLVSKWGARKLADIRKADIIVAIDDDVDRGKPIVANRRLATVSALFNWGLSRDLIAASPTAGVAKPGTEKARDRILTDEELLAVWNAAGDVGWPFGPIVQLLILTGQRRDEVAGMRWSELDLKAKTWTLPRGRVKNDSGHEVPLSPPVIEIIEKLPRMKGSAFVFTTTGDTTVSGFSKIKRKLDAKSGVTDWVLHDLRRSAASGMARLGIALPVIEKVLNHSSGSFAGIVGVYQRHSFADEKRAALEAWGRHVAGLIEPKRANVVELSATRAV
jgi:integrase